MRPMVEIIAKDAVAAMMRRIGGAFNVQHVILVGGGAFLFKKAVKQAFSTHQILEMKEPMFANVRGYQIAGTNYAQTPLSSANRQRGATVAEGGGA
jgi:plasmid segregation protein ParM